MDAPVALHEMTFNHRDEFHRKTIAENIIKLLDADVDFCPMVIDGGWGTGKTEFCHKLINLIKEQDAARRASVQPATGTPPTEAGQGGESHPENTQQPERTVIYLDAFASETVDDPLLCILAAIRAEFPEDTKKAVGRMAVPLIKALGKIGLKGIISWLLKQKGEDIFKELADAAKNDTHKLIDTALDKLLDQYASVQQNIKFLKDAIAKGAKKKPIIFFIDELDRCRPDFALSILELVKHVFEVPGIKFVFVANMEQLKAVIRKRYGQDVDADVYLEKFVNLSIVLPPVDNKTQQNAACMLLEKELQYTGLFNNRRREYKKFINHFVEKYDIRLRGIKKLINNIKIYTALTKTNPLSKKNIFADNIIFLLSMFIFTFDKELSQKLISGKFDEAFFNFVGKSQDTKLNDILFILTNIIYYGNSFTTDNFRSSDEQVEIWTKLFKARFEKRFYCGSLTMQSYAVCCIRRMNMLSIKG